MAEPLRHGGLVPHTGPELGRAWLERRRAELEAERAIVGLKAASDGASAGTRAAESDEARVETGGRP